MGDLESQVSRTEFPTEGQLLQAAFYVSSANFVRGKEDDIHKVYDVFEQEKNARDQNPAATTIRIRNLDATYQVYNQQLKNAQKNGDRSTVKELTYKRNMYAYAKDVGRSMDILDAELVSRVPSPIFDKETSIPTVVEIGLADGVSFPKLDLKKKVYPEEASTHRGREEALWFLSKLSSYKTPDRKLLLESPEELLDIFEHYTLEETGRSFSLVNVLGAVKRQISYITSRSEFIDIDPEGEIKTYKQLKILIEQAIDKVKSGD